MDTAAKSLNKEEKENVLLVLSEFTDEYRSYVRTLTTLTVTVKEFMGKIDDLIKTTENKPPQFDGKVQDNFNKSIVNNIDKLDSLVENIALTERNLYELSANRDRNNSVLQSITRQKVLHHHYFNKPFWVVTALCVLFVFASIGWYKAADKAAKYEACDIKYRYLGLKGTPQILQRLYVLDSLQRSNYAMKDSVILWETNEKQEFELSKKLKLKLEEDSQLKSDLQKIEKGNRQRKEAK